MDFVEDGSEKEAILASKADWEEKRKFEAQEIQEVDSDCCDQTIYWDTQRQLSDPSSGLIQARECHDQTYEPQKGHFEIGTK